MTLFSALKAKNFVTAYVYDKDGNLKSKQTTHNITCTSGRADIMNRMIDFETIGTSRKGVVRYMGIGTDDTAAVEGDTLLGAESNRSPILPDETIQVTSITTKFYARFGAGYGLTIKEAGLFTGDGAGSAVDTGALLARTVFGTPITKTTDEVVVLEWSVSLNNG